MSGTWRPVAARLVHALYLEQPSWRKNTQTPACTLTDPHDRLAQVDAGGEQRAALQLLGGGPNLPAGAMCTAAGRPGCIENSRERRAGRQSRVAQLAPAQLPECPSAAPLDRRRCLSRLRLPSINLPAPVAPMGRWLVQQRLVGLPSWGPGGKAHILVVGPHRHSLHCGGGHGCR